LIFNYKKDIIYTSEYDYGDKNIDYGDKSSSFIAVIVFSKSL